MHCKRRLTHFFERWETFYEGERKLGGQKKIKSGGNIRMSDKKKEYLFGAVTLMRGNKLQSATEDFSAIHPTDCILLFLKLQIAILLFLKHKFPFSCF